jgi:hypothetical protein
MGAVSDTEIPLEPSPRPPTRVPGVWAQMPLPVRVGLIALLVVAASGIYAVTRLHFQSSANLDNGVVEQLIPADGDKLLQQARIGIDLQTGYNASLAVNGVALPEDQVDRIAAFNQVLFQPGPGKAFEAWPAGRNCIVATYYKYETGPTQSSSLTWCFSVV